MALQVVGVSKIKKIKYTHESRGTEKAAQAMPSKN
jgi:hypothetical protein